MCTAIAQICRMAYCFCVTLLRFSIPQTPIIQRYIKLQLLPIWGVLLCTGNLQCIHKFRSFQQTWDFAWQIERCEIFSDVWSTTHYFIGQGELSWMYDYKWFVYDFDKSICNFVYACFFNSGFSAPLTGRKCSDIDKTIYFLKVPPQKNFLLDLTSSFLPSSFLVYVIDQIKRKYFLLFFWELLFLNLNYYSPSKNGHWKFSTAQLILLSLVYDVPSLFPCGSSFSPIYQYFSIPIGFSKPMFLYFNNINQTSLKDNLFQLYLTLHSRVP